MRTEMPGLVLKDSLDDIFAGKDKPLTENITS
jgi:hypothetical protein